jgi:predicted unusual protein kinase regulating ubiquinone biosynthesis (AarF/ABC1/UbiB family)
MSPRLLLQLLGLAGDAIRLPFRRLRKAGSLSTDAATRKDELHSLAGTVARAAAVARVRSIFQKDRREEIEREAMERAARQAVEQLGQMKGLMMKLGQQMSYLNALPEDAERGLASLQASVPPLDPDQLDAVLHRSFGRDLDRVFAEFDREPIAAASVGQVHRARLKDGREVAVKLQYPGVEEAMRADLDNLESLTAVSAMTLKADMGEYTRTLNESFLRELDYTQEQRNQQRLADLFQGHPYVLIPNTVPELCTPTVLVSEFVRGRTLQQVADTATQGERDRLGEIMYRFAFGCVASGFFSGDPHPGNYLFPEDGRVCFIDFGMVIEFDRPEHVGRISEVLAGALNGDETLIADGLQHLGLAPAGTDPAAIWAELQPLVAGPIEGGRVRLDRERFSEAVQGVNSRGGGKSALGAAIGKSNALESWMLFWVRYALGALATISKLRPEVDWRHVVEEMVLGADPAGEIGERWGDAPGGSTFAATRFGTSTKAAAKSTRKPVNTKAAAGRTSLS